MDGRLVGRGNNFSVADNYVIDSGSEVIALKCQGRLPPWEGGILGSFSSGLVTDSSWKCTAQYELGWNMKSYNDEQWPNAVSYKKNLPMSLPWGQRDNVLSNAQWIWTQDNENDTTIYCRHELVNRCMKGTYVKKLPYHNNNNNTNTNNINTNTNTNNTNTNNTNTIPIPIIPIPIPVPIPLIPIIPIPTPIIPIPIPIIPTPIPIYQYQYQ